MNIRRQHTEKLIEKKKLKGYEYKIFENKDEARDYINSKIDNTTIGIGASVTFVK